MQLIEPEIGLPIWILLGVLIGLVVLRTIVKLRSKRK